VAADKVKPLTLGDWLEHLERIHPQSIAMGLDRVERVRRALGLAPDFPVITVGGTNGKGSCCAMLEAILHQAGYRVGCYTSPHLLRYNERVRVSLREASDEELCRAFARVEAARYGPDGETLLTYFEFGTLAALLVFVEAGVDAAIFEVGLGGRLDAVNIFDADCAVLAAIDIDHTEYLGTTREAIGFEKAGIFRAGRPAICADRAPPSSVTAHAHSIGAQLLLIDRDFGGIADEAQWQYWGPAGKRYGLPHPALRGRYQFANAAASITALDCLRDRLPVTAQDVRNGLLHVVLPGRFQVLPGRPRVILDVAHNAQAARSLAENLASMRAPGATIAVMSLLKDKDVAGVAAALANEVTHWHLASLPGARGSTARALEQALRACGVSAPIETYDSVAEAWRSACEKAADDDKIVVFGSFLTVAEVMREQARARSGAIHK
jgi:dihydrofolate synthase / folylpolyglutamate synthase